MTNFLYNPDRKSKSQLIAEFVVRNQILDEIMEDLESSDMTKPEQHYLLVGQRGTGKTTLLHRIKYAIEDSPQLSNWLIPVIFSEEQYNISELANLWENTAHVLEDYHGFEGISEAMEANITRKDFEEKCYEILEKELDTKGKKLVLLIDNVGDLLKKLDTKEVHRLREILQTKHQLRLIAGSPFYLDSILDYKQPFFEFFKVKRLEGLNKEEAQELLLKLGEVHGQKEKIERIITETPERIETLRILTGGVPRTIGLMFQIFIDYEHESSLKDLERVLDAVTPLYKHRMDDLPKQQQKIVDAVARNWDAISVKGIKEKIRLESKIISAQLRQLEKNQIIEKRETSTKNHLYLLRERFWNIWYLMRYGRKTDSERVIWLVRFLESWCSNIDIEKRVENLTKAMIYGSQKVDGIDIYSQVYLAINNISTKTKTKLLFSKRIWDNKDLNKELIVSINEDISKKNIIEAFVKTFKLSYIPNDLKRKLIENVHLFYQEAGKNPDINPFDKFDYIPDSISAGFVFCISLFNAFHTVNFIVLNQQEDVHESFISITELIEDINSVFENSFSDEMFKLENQIFETTIYNMLASGYLKIVMNAFVSGNYPNLEKKYEPIYLACSVLYDKNIFANLAPEKQSLVLSIIEKIESIKSEY